MTLATEASPFVKNAASTVRWTFLRLTIYATAAIVTASVFFAGAAFYSFVWPAPPISTVHLIH
jgi:hypothetical protein